MKIMIATHGYLADGVKSTLSLFVDTTDMVCVNAYVTEEDYIEKIKSFINSIPPSETGLIFTDMYGGSVNQKVMELDRSANIKVITGFNIPLILEICVSEITEDEELEKTIENAREQMKVVRLENVTVSEENDDEFLS